MIPHLSPDEDSLNKQVPKEAADALAIYERYADLMQDYPESFDRSLPHMFDECDLKPDIIKSYCRVNIPDYSPHSRNSIRYSLLKFKKLLSEFFGVSIEDMDSQWQYVEHHKDDILNKLRTEKKLRDAVHNNPFCK